MADHKLTETHFLDSLCHKLPGAPIPVAERNRCEDCCGDLRYPNYRLDGSRITFGDDAHNGSKDNR